MNINWKKTSLVIVDVILASYLVLAATSFNRPDKSGEVCESVNIAITDNENFGFLGAEDIKAILVNKRLFPNGKPLQEIEPRTIEDVLRQNSFVNKAECYKTLDGTVNIRVSQRMPYIRIMADNGEDYYLDEDGNVMQGAGYTSDLIVATGEISKWYACNYLSPVSKFVSADEFWRNQIEQIHVLPNKYLELVPRVGNHVVCLGRLPEFSDKARRNREIDRFMEHKLMRLMKFYQYGLNKIGWNKYSYINLEFDNQIICKKLNKKALAEMVKEEAAGQENAPQKDTEQHTAD